jgi:hypothetical protein
MAKQGMIGKIAIWAFIIGAIISLFIGLWQAWNLQNNEIPILATDNGVWIGWLLAFLGLVVGILAVLGRGTITKSEVPAFLTAGIALLIMYGVFKEMAMALKPWLGPLLYGISLPLAIFIAPAVGLLSIKAIWDIGKDV